MKPALSPTLLVIGINRSGTTALAQSFLNNPVVEVYKDPGKFAYETSGQPDFSHFFLPAKTPLIKARFIKQSIGQYTPDLCTIPLFPIGPGKCDLISRLRNIVLIRDPAAVWKSWRAMTAWIEASDDPSVLATWERLQSEYGIRKGWGGVDLLTLCYQYLLSTYKYIREIDRDAVTVLSYEAWVKSPDAVTRWLCDWSGVPFCLQMVDWELEFGRRSERLVDGFAEYGAIDSPERSFIHRTIRGTRGVGIPGVGSQMAVRAEVPGLGASLRAASDAYGEMLRDYCGPAVRD